MLEIRAQPVPALNEDGTLRDQDEPEIITTFSWRNFFSTINFVHVLQKLTKRKCHRILLLVQYKSSVSPSHGQVADVSDIVSGHSQAHFEDLASSIAALCA